MFRKVKARLYAAPAPSSQPLTPPLPPTLNSATKNVHGVISRLVRPQTGLREFPHLLARVETPAGYVPRSGAARGLMGERSSVWVLAASSSYSSTLVLSKQPKKRTRATAKPAPLGLLLPSAAFFTLDLGSLLPDSSLWSRHSAHDFRRRAGGLPSALSIRSPKPRSLRFHRRLCLQVLDDLILGLHLPLLQEFFSLMETSNLFFQLLLFCLFILFMGFSRQEHWSGLPFPSPVDHVRSKLSTMNHPYTLGGPTRHGS